MASADWRVVGPAAGVGALWFLELGIESPWCGRVPRFAGGTEN